MGLQAGAAVRDITPRRSLFLVGYPNVERDSTGVHDPLLASALCLRNGGDTLVLVAVDILQMDPQLARELRRAIAGRVDIPEASVFISCTHTHSGPVTQRTRVEKPDEEYLSEFRAGIVEAAIAAADDLRDAELAWTAADAREVGGNRHQKDGICDPEVGVLIVRDAGTNRPLAISMTCSMHPTVLHEDSTLVSSDFPHYARVGLREALVDDVVVLHHTGPAGNQSPRYHVSAQTFDEAERLGRMLASRVIAAVEGIENDAFSVNATLSALLRSVALKPRALPTVAEGEQLLRDRVAEHERLKTEGAPHGPVRTAECAVFGAEHAVAFSRMREAGEWDRLISAYTPTEVQAMRIGDVCLAGLPGELFVEYGLEIKRRASRRTFVVSLVNGDLRGYIVTPEAAEAGCYEASTGIFDASAGRVLVDAAVDLLNGLSKMILAIDLGSTSFKSAVFDRDLRRLGGGASELSYLSPVDGAMELDVDVVHRSLREIVASVEVNVGDVSAIGITSQAQTFAVCDADGRPKRPFISWRDRRAGDVAEALARDPRLAGFGDHASLHAPTPAMHISLLKRLQAAEPDLIAETDTVEQLGPYVVRALSGQSWTDDNLAAMGGLFSMGENDWWAPALLVCALRREQLPRVCPIGTSPCATSAAAETFGLRPDIPIVLAGNDQTAGACGAAIHETGALLITLGTAEVVYVCCDTMPEPTSGLIRGVYPGGKFYRLVIAGDQAIAEAVDALGVDPKRTPVLAAGGGSRSPERVEQLAEQLGTEIKHIDADPLLGAARMASVA